MNAIEMNDTAELLDFLREYSPLDAIHDVQYPAQTDSAILAGLIGNTDDLVATVNRYRLENESLSSTLESIKRTADCINRKQTEDSKYRQRLEREVEDLRQRCDTLERCKLNSEMTFSQTLADVEEKAGGQKKATESLLQDVTRQYLQQLHMLNHTRGLSGRAQWRKTCSILNARIETFPVVAEIFKEHSLSKSTDLEVKTSNAHTSCDDLIKFRCTGTNTTGIRTNTTVNVGVNTMIQSKITRSTQCGSAPARTEERGTMFDVRHYTSGEPIVDYTHNMEPQLPLLDSLEASPQSMSCQTDSIAKPDRKDAETITELRSLKRVLEYKQNESVKMELTDFNFDCLDFEQLWAMTGRALINRIDGKKRSPQTEPPMELFKSIARDDVVLPPDLDPIHQHSDIEGIPPKQGKYWENNQNHFAKIVDFVLERISTPVQKEIIRNDPEDEVCDTSDNVETPLGLQQTKTVSKRKSLFGTTRPLKKIKLVHDKKPVSRSNKQAFSIKQIIEHLLPPKALGPIPDIDYTSDVELDRVEPMDSDSVSGIDNLEEDQLQITEDQPQITEDQPQIKKDQPKITEEQPQITEDPYLESPRSPEPVNEDRACTAPLIIPTESRSTNVPIGMRCPKGLIVTNSILNQLLQQYNSNERQKVQKRAPERLTKSLKNILQEYLTTEWTSESAQKCVDEMMRLCNGDKSDIVAAILTEIEYCKDDILYEPFTSFAPHMPKTHQMVVLIITKMNLAVEIINKIEAILFNFKNEGIAILSIINYTYIYLTLQDLRLNCSLNVTSNLRAFLVKALYYMTRKSVVIVYMALKVFPRLIPRMTETSEALINLDDPLVITLACILLRDSCSPDNHKDHPAIQNHKRSLGHLLKTYYKYQIGDQFTVATVTAALVDRLKNGKHLNLMHAFLIIAKRWGWEWARDTIVSKELWLLLHTWLDEIKSEESTAELEDKICLTISIIAGIVKTYPRTEDVSLYREMFKNILMTADYPEAVQEAAVMGVLQLCAFGVLDTYQAIDSWYTKKGTISASLKATMKTFIYRFPAAYWVGLSRESRV